MKPDDDDPLKFSVLIGTDAMRLCMGKKPRNFTREEVIRWLTLMGATAIRKGQPN